MNCGGINLASYEEAVEVGLKRKLDRAAHRMGAAQLFLEEALAERAQLWRGGQYGAVALAGDMQDVIAGEDHIRKENPFIEQRRDVVVIAVGFEGGAGEQRGNQALQAV